MVEQYIEQLTSRDPNRRRTAIIALSKTGDARALGPLNSVAQTDPDPALRELAAKAEHLIQKARWAQVADQSAGLYVPRPAEPVERPAEVSPERVKKGKLYLTRAFDFRTKGDTQNALAALVDALKANPALAKDPAATSLAADLVGAPPTDAVTILLEGRLGKPIAKQAGPALDRPSITGMRLVAAELPILYVVLVVLTAVITVRVTVLNPALNDIFTGLTGPNLLKAAPVALLLLGFVLLDVVVMYVVGLWIGGVGSYLRFGSAVFGVMIVILLVVLLALIFFPVVGLVATPGGMAIVADWRLMLVIVLAILIFPGYFAAQAHDIKLGLGVLTAFIGTAITFVLANVLGILNGVTFG